MKAKSFADMRCSIARSLEHVGSWWSLLIIRDAMMGVHRFSQFQRSLGIARQTLTNRLNQLVANGILRKTPAADGSAYDDYELTDKGRDLAPVLIALAQWGDNWAEHKSGRSFTFIDTDSGEELSRVLPRRDDGSEVPFSEISLKPNAERNSL